MLDNITLHKIITS